MQLTDNQRSVLLKLNDTNGCWFREEDEKQAIDQMCRMVPPLVCDYHIERDSYFTRITEEGRTELLDDEVAVSRMDFRNKDFSK